MRVPALSLPSVSTASRCAVTMLFGLGAQQKPELGAPLLGDSAPAWSDLQAKVHATATGTRMLEAEAEWSRGAGPAHTDAKLRLFGKKEEDVRVVFYRDTAAWCPYCQKVWLLLEEKEIPYRLEKINMRSYGDKPAEFLRRVPNGLLPAIEIDGQFMTDSLPIMQTLDAAFDQGPPMVPPPGTSERERAQKLLGLERTLFGAWCQLTFQPGKGLMDSHEKNILRTLKQVDEALGETAGPWFLGGEAPSLVDLQYVSHVERMLASLLYWKGLPLRGTGQLPQMDAWLAAFEARPAYLATKSDYYTHCMDIPPQYGPGQSVGDAAPYAKVIDGDGGAGAAWQLPLELGPEGRGKVEPLAPLQDAGDEAARHEAAFELIKNHAAVAAFAARGAGEPGDKQFQAALADPYAKPSKEALPAVDVCLRHVAHALLEGTEAAAPSATADLGSGGSRPALAISLAYLRDRVGVPRDMGQAAGMHFRANLNWMIGQL